MQVVNLLYLCRSVYPQKVWNSDFSTFWINSIFPLFSPLIALRSQLVYFFTQFFNAVYIVEQFIKKRLIFHDPFFHLTIQVATKIEYLLTFLLYILRILHMLRSGLHHKKLFWAPKSAVYNRERFQIKSGLRYKKTK